MVVVIDDDIDLAKMMCAKLKEENIEFLYIHDAQDAIETIYKHINEIDLVLTDYCMPNVDGIELYINIKTIRKNIPILIITAFGADFFSDINSEGLNKYGFDKNKNVYNKTGEIEDIDNIIKKVKKLLAS